MAMTVGVGGSTPEKELARLFDMTTGIEPVSQGEYQRRIVGAQQIMQREGIVAVYLNAGTNLFYFTGMQWKPSERMVGAVLPAQGMVQYIAPAFEEDTIKDFMVLSGEIYCWHEDESPYQLFSQMLAELNVASGNIGIDESTPFFISNGIHLATEGYQLVDAKPVTAGCRSCKTQTEIAYLQRAKEMTMEVHKATARILKTGICTTEVQDFIHQAHIKVGAPKGAFFCTVLFGVCSSFPHGVKNPQLLKEGDIVLIDTGCEVEGYKSDITRTYVYGEPNERQRQVWNAEKASQQAAFEAAKLGEPCGSVDLAARQQLLLDGFESDYALPGLPHRTGHGTGLDIHEWPYLVRSDMTPLAVGMVFSNEPMICVPGEFGIRLEDHFYMTESGPKWFTEPAHSIDNPFGYDV
ncbi:M24 family metallopeptidase [Photobacterium profundum]|uniref:M24 family metallopeptidase n=1 Tax=Photobacterium profundum TaxID=74109 RepID=UPI003D1183C3